MRDLLDKELKNGKRTKVSFIRSIIYEFSYL